MKIVGCDLHARQQTMAMVDTETGEFSEKTLAHEGNMVREFYAALDGPVGVGIEATGAMQWFLELLEQLGIECRVGHPAKIRGAETRQQKHDRRDARLELKLLVEDRFPTIWMPSIEQRDLRSLLRDRHQWVKMRSRLQHTLQAIALNHALRIRQTPVNEFYKKGCQEKKLRLDRRREDFCLEIQPTVVSVSPDLLERFALA
jgi:transposase